MPYRSLLVLLAALAAPMLHAQNRDDWYQPFPAHRIHGNLYYVGTGGLASYLITTSDGHILINSSFEESVPLIRASVEKLGFRFHDIKILLTSHAHGDHAAGSALVKELTAAKVMVMTGDEDVVAKGSGKNWKPCKVDRVLHDLDEVKLGGMKLVAHHTPGHTKGATTWTFPVTDGEKVYNVVIVSSVSVNPGYILVNNKEYPQIAEDYQKSFRILKTLSCDIFLAPHGIQYGLSEKYAKLGQKANPFVDPEGYAKANAEKEKEFQEKWAAQKK